LKELFREIWIERPHYCECCHKELGEIPLAHFFSHILSKGAFPKYKHNKDNIILICMNCHNDWEYGNRSLIKFSLKKRLYDLLKNKY